MTGVELLAWLQGLPEEDLNREVATRDVWDGEVVYGSARASVRHVETPWLNSMQSGHYIVIEGPE